jgi:hypothetical protein
MGTTAGTNFIYLKEGKISVQTSDYFAVGSTVEVLGTTWTKGTLGTDVATSGASNNAYRKFKITGHVTNEFNREFAKLDSFPADDGVTVATANNAKPDYNLKITSNNGTVRTYPAVGTGIAAKVTVNEIQVITLGTGKKDANTNQVWKLYYKGEETQNMDHASTEAQVAEEINGFSALSGAVTVSGEGTVTADGTAGSVTGFPRYAVTFAAQDGDVAEMTAVSTAGTNAAGNTNGNVAVTVTTRANGWSIEAPLAFGLDTLQAGGIINVTAQEVCTFTFDMTPHATVLEAGYYCYNGVCGTKATSGSAPHAKAAIESIKDDTGKAIFSLASNPDIIDVLNSDSDAATYDSFVVTLPLGKSCDGLEVHGTASATTKSVAKNNNGKQFKITRSFLQKTAFASIASDSSVSCADGACHGAVLGVDSVVFGGANCDAKTVAETNYPFTRTSSSVTLSGDGTATAVGFVTAVGASTGSNCPISYIARHVITLDSMPTASGTSVSKSLEYTSPVGSCSVTETTKGTYESYECSNRGACDGKSGLCTCYEGYSGQSCQTQTVLV